MNKKHLLLALCLALSLSMSACGEKQTVPSDSAPPPPVTDMPSDGNPPAEEQPEIPELPEDPSDDQTPSEPSDPGEEQPEEPSDPEPPVVAPPVTQPPVTQPPATEQPKPPAVTPPQQEYDVLLASTTNGLQVRTGAGTKYASMGSLDQSDMVAAVRKSDGWYEVYYKNTRGFVSSAYVKSVQFAKGSNQVENVISEGKKLLGIPYELGAQRYHWGNGVKNTDFTGKTYDCSSLMQYIFKVGAGVNLDMTSRSQSLQGTYVARKNIRRGDLLFFTNSSRVNKTGLERIGHVALYLGDNMILHTASDHAVIEPISAQRSSYYITARRFL